MGRSSARFGGEEKPAGELELRKPNDRRLADRLQNTREESSFLEQMGDQTVGATSEPPNARALCAFAALSSSSSSFLLGGQGSCHPFASKGVVVALGKPKVSPKIPTEQSGNACCHIQPVSTQDSSFSKNAH